MYIFKFNEICKKSNRFHLKMESDEEIAAAMVPLLLVKKN